MECTARTPPARSLRLVPMGGGFKHRGAAVGVPDGGAKGVGVPPTDRLGHHRRAQHRRGRQRASVPAPDTVAAATLAGRGTRVAAALAPRRAPPRAPSAGQGGGDGSSTRCRRRWASAPTWTTGPARAAPMAVLWPRQAVTAKGCGGGSSRLQGRPQAPPVQRRVAASGPHQAGRLPRRIFFTLAAPAAVSRRGAAVARRTATLAHRVAASRVDVAARRWRRWQPLPLSQCRCCRLAGRRSRCCGCRGAGEGGSLTRPVEGR